MSVCSSPFCPLRPDSPCARRYGLSLRNTFVLSGLSSIATGLMFDIPMAVQPMKSIAAVALTAEAGEFSIESMLAAGIITAQYGHDHSVICADIFKAAEHTGWNIENITFL